MYLSKISIENFRCFGEGDKAFTMTMQPGLTALVGENDSGKTAVIDAIRYALGTSDLEWNRLEDSDFNSNADSREIKVLCKFENLTSMDKRAFVEYLTYGMDPDDQPALYVHWSAKDTGDIYHGRPHRRIEVRSGMNGDGPKLDSNARALLYATYLRPLRDAEQALSGGRKSRLAQILLHSKTIRDGDIHDPATPLIPLGHELSILGIINLVDDLLKEQKGIKATRIAVDTQLKDLTLNGDTLISRIKISDTDISENLRIRQMLEKLDLALSDSGKAGLGSNNLLFIACELLLLAEEDGCKLLLIEEPEAHLHAQRQLRTMKYLQDQAKNKGIQIVITTHSPNLTSAINLNNIIMIQNRRAFPMAEGNTKLAKSDYRFLERFLDVTKANLFFARGVVIVEGDAENILLPTLARLIGRDFTEHGVSIVNVGSTGLRRYARIFQRNEVDDIDIDKQLHTPVACVTDLDVMPDCAPNILGKQKNGNAWPPINKRRWRTSADFRDSYELYEFRKNIYIKASGQQVITFVADEWTLEYDLAIGPKDKTGKYTGGLAEDVFIASQLAKKDENRINFDKDAQKEVIETAINNFDKIKKFSIDLVNNNEAKGYSVEEVISSCVYSEFTLGTVASKTITAQYLAERLLEQNKKQDYWRKLLPSYLVEAIDYVTKDPRSETALDSESTSDE